MANEARGVGLRRNQFKPEPMFRMLLSAPMEKHVLKSNSTSPSASRDRLDYGSFVFKMPDIADESSTTPPPHLCGCRASFHAS